MTLAGAVWREAGQTVSKWKLDQTLPDLEKIVQISRLLSLLHGNSPGRFQLDSAGAARLRQIP